MNYIVGARASKLSMAQTNWVISELTKVNLDSKYTIKPITTSGDTDTRPLYAMDQKGIFEKEIDKAVAQKQIDFAVHSLKDIPVDLDEQLCIASIPKRETVNDILVSMDGSDIDNIKKGALVGTSSLRRAVQISRKRPDLILKPIRGNIETRINKVADGHYDSIVIAKAGVQRLGIDVQYSTLSINDFMPSPGQGAIGIVARKTDTNTISMLEKIQDPTSRYEIEAERALSAFVDSGCRFPLGAYAKSDGTSMKLSVSAFSVDGKESLELSKIGKQNNPLSLGAALGEELKEKGLGELALNWREKVAEWNKK